MVSEPSDPHLDLLLRDLLAWFELRLPRELRHRADPEELLQEAICRAWPAFPGLADAVDRRRWTFGIARNVLRETLRGLARDRERQVTWRSAWQSALPAELTSLTERTARRETVAHLLARVAVLGAEDRRLVLLRGIERLPFGEVATRLAVAEEAAKKRWQRLRGKLRELVPE